jgi:hypothetical protein
MMITECASMFETIAEETGGDLDIGALDPHNVVMPEPFIMSSRRDC